MAHYQQMEAIVWVQLVNNWQLLIQHLRSLATTRPRTTSCSYCLISFCPAAKWYEPNTETYILG